MNLNDMRAVSMKEIPVEEAYKQHINNLRQQARALAADGHRVVFIEPDEPKDITKEVNDLNKTKEIGYGVQRSQKR